MKRVLILLAVAMSALIITSCGASIIPDGWVAAKVAEREITFGDITVFKQNRTDDMSDKRALDMIIEREVLFEEAKILNITATLEEAKKEVHKAKMALITNGSEEDKKNLDRQVKTLGISNDEYWNEYLPKSYMKLMTMVRMKKIIREQIGKGILQNYSYLTNRQMQKKYDELYDKKLEELKGKYEVEYYID